MNKRNRSLAIATGLLALGLTLDLLPAGKSWSSPMRPTGQAILFGIGGDFTLRQFRGATIGYQRSQDEDRAWRISLEINLGYEETEATTTSLNWCRDFIEAGGSKKYEDSDSYLSARLERLRYRGSGVAIFYGWGPSVFVGTRTGGDWYYYPCEDKWVGDRYRAWEMGAGLGGCLGVQWSATDWLTLHAEYEAEAIYSNRIYEYRTEVDEKGLSNDRYIHDKYTVNRIALNSRGVRFGLSVYF